MADGRASDVLDLYWKALNDGRTEEAARLKAAFHAEYQSLLRNFELLDQLLEARDALDSEENPGQKASE